MSTGPVRSPPAFVRRRRIALAIVLVTAVVIGCTGDGAQERGGESDVPVGTWVNELCTELGRFARSSLAPAADFWLDVEVFDELTARFEELAVRVAGLGTPSVARGDDIASEILARLRESASTLKDVRPDVIRMADGEQPQDSDAFLERVVRAAMYPYALLSIL